MKARELAADLALILLVAVAYFPATQCGFIWDDDFYVSGNANLRTGTGLATIWLEPRQSPQYYPLVFTSFWLEYHLVGPSPAFYHWTNLLLHGLSAVLFRHVLTALRVPGAWLAAALFAVHPVCVESVAWITERKNVLSGVMFWLAILAYFRFSPPRLSESSGQRRSWGWYCLSIGFFAGALLSKTVTCSLPAVLLLLLWWQRGRVTRRDLLCLAPFFVLGLSLASVTIWMEKHHVGAYGREWELSGWQRVLLAGRALWFYLGKLLAPNHLTFIYPRWTVDAGVWWQYLFPAAVVAVVFTLWLERNRIGAGWLVGCLCFAGVLVPALGFFDVYPFRYSFVADHFQYLAATAALALLAAMGVAAADHLDLGQGCRGVLCSLLLAGLGFLTWAQCHVYLDEESLWKDTLNKNPECFMAHRNLGLLLLEEHRDDEALAHFLQYEREHPDQQLDRCGLATALMRKGQWDRAREQAVLALREEPGMGEAHLVMGAVHAHERNYDEAERLYRKALVLEDPPRSVYLKLGTLLALKQQWDEACDYLQEALKKDPQSHEARLALGTIWCEQGKYREGVEVLRQAVELQPGASDCRITLGLALQGAGKPQLAEEQFVEAMRRDRRWPLMMFQPAWVLATSLDPRMRNGALAVTLAEALCQARQSPDATFWDLLAAAYAEAGRFKEAESWASQAVELAEKKGQVQMARTIRQHLELFRSRECVRRK